MSGGSRRVRGFRLVAQNLNHPEMIVVGAPPGERYRVRNAFDAQPATAARKHSEMGEVERRTRGLVRMFVSSGSILDRGVCLQSPGRSGFQAGMHHAHDLHGLKEIGYRVQLKPPNPDSWTSQMDEMTVRVQIHGHLFPYVR